MHFCKFILSLSIVILAILLVSSCSNEVQDQYAELTTVSLEVVKLRSLNEQLSHNNPDPNNQVYKSSKQVDKLIDSLQMILINETGGYTMGRKGDLASEFRDARNTVAPNSIFQEQGNCQKLESVIAQLLIASNAVNYTIAEANRLSAIRSELTQGQVCDLLRDQSMLESMILLAKVNLFSQLHSKQLQVGQ